jgi:AcrR family transcriptional regulator
MTRLTVDCKSNALHSSEWCFTGGMRQTAPRAIARQQQVAVIKATARRFLADKGASELSLREVAREMGQTSSALYRYFANRDELLTALILDAYDELGAAVERAEARVPRGEVLDRWLAAGRAVRRWAVAHPHEYALLFGSPVPGYHAPEETVAAATRVTTVIAGIVDDRCRSSGIAGDRSDDERVDRYLEIGNLRTVMPDVPADVLARSVMAWTQLFGSVSFELFGHYRHTVRRPAAFFDQTLLAMASMVGIGD